MMKPLPPTDPDELEFPPIHPPPSGDEVREASETWALEQSQVLTSWELGYEKPDERIFEAALGRLRARNKGLKPEEILYVGDELHA